MASSADRVNAIPMVYATGSHYEVGYAVGSNFSGIIKSFLGSFSYFKDNLLPAYETEIGRHNYTLSLTTAERNFPQYVREIRGTAVGAGVPFHHLMLLHLDRLVLVGASPAAPASLPQHGCSSVCCNYEGQVLLGHTEDALDDVLNHLYLVSAHIYEEEPQGKYKVQKEAFTSLCYAGYLPGFCMGYNLHGLVYSINVLFPKTVIPGKTAPYFLTRALLGAPTLDDVQRILLDEGVGAADGFSVNVTFAVKDADPVFHNFEVGHANYASSALSLHPVICGQHFLHTNMYLRLDIPEDTSYEGLSSTHRHRRADECQPPDCRAALLDLLSDTRDRAYPIFRETNQDGVITVTLGVFDLKQKTWSLYMKNPRTAPNPVVTLPLDFSWMK